MSEPHSHQVRVPRGALIAAGVLIGLTIGAVAVFRIGDLEPVATVPAPDATVDSRTLRFEDRADGSVAVYEISEGQPDRIVHVLETGDGGFIRGVLRSLARARRAGGIGREQPFHLSLQADGRLLLEDPATRQRIYLQAFGPTNVESFRTLLASEAVEQRAGAIAQ